MENCLRFQFVDKPPARPLWVRTLLLTLLLLAGCLFQVSFAQTTIIGAANGGNFDLGSTFTANGWTEVNGTSPNKWFVGNVPTGFTGNSAYVSDNATGTTHNYAVGSPNTTHFYRDVMFPAGEPNVVLSFQWKGMGEGALTTLFDGLQVSLAPVATTVTANVATGGTSAAFQ